MNYKGNSRFGALPRRTMIANQPHMLAYINPQEEMLLRQLGGAGEPVGPMGIPAYYFGYGGQEQPDANFGYEAPSGGGGGGNQGVSVNDYNNAIARVNQPLERGYNQDARNRDLATIDAYNASFAPVNDPSEIATPTISSPVSIDSGMGAAIDANDGVSDIGLDGGFLGVSDGGSGYVDSGTDVSAGVTGTDFDFGMGSVDGVGDVGTGDIGSGGVDFDSGGDFLGEFGGSGVDIGGGISAGVTGTDFDFGAGSIDGEGDVGTGNIGSGGVDFDSGGDYLGEFGGSGVDLGVDVSAGVTGADADYGMGSIDGIGTSAGEYTVDPTDTSGSTTTSIVGTSMFDNMRALRGLPPLGEIEVTADDATSSADVSDADYGMGSIDGVSDVGVSDTGSGGVDFDSGGDYLGEFGGSGVDLGVDISGGAPENDFDFGMGSTDGVGTSAGEGDVGISIDPNDNPYAIDIQDTNIYTENDDGTYSIEDGEPDPEPDFDPGEYIGGPGDGEGDNGAATTPADTVPDFAKVEYNFNTSLEASPYGGMWSGITSTVPKYEFNAYEDEDGLLRFSDNDEPVPPEILKYLGYAKKTLIEEEEETEEEAA